jgi:hypothetical protein
LTTSLRFLRTVSGIACASAVLAAAGCTPAIPFSTEPVDPGAPPVLLLGPTVPSEPLVPITGVVGVAENCVVLQLDDGSFVLPYWPKHFGWSSKGTIATIYGEIEIGQRLTKTSGNILNWEDYRAAWPAAGEVDRAHEPCASVGARVAPLGSVEEIAGPE